MSNIDDAADQVLGLAERFRGIIEIAGVIKSIGSLDQAISERQAGLVTVTEQHEAAKAELATTGTELYALRTAQADELAQHQKDCAALSDKATADAAEIIRQAQSTADATEAATNIVLRASQQAHDEAIAAKQTELADLQSKIDDAQKALDAINAAHTDTAARVEALKAAAKSVLGDA